jgi:hypothetical protein
VAGGATYEVCKEGLMRITRTSFWDWVRGHC